MPDAIRVRFAPSPTGLLHLGSVRTALFNYIFAHKYHGTFILRIEDTDPERNFDPGATIILQDLAWLDLNYDEGPLKGGPYAPYFQSERTAIYQQMLDDLIKKKYVYRCFCTAQELEKKRARQMALKKPPRYDRTCLELSDKEITQHLAKDTPYIWRFKIPQQEILTISDLVRGPIEFNMNNFSDFPLTRNDGSFTFIFANAVDDIKMKISHVFRGEDHISNTPCQALLYQAFNAPMPIFWHMPILCNIEGKKLSKRDFGFSLRDLKAAGYLPEAICNYLGIIGGSFEQEIMPLATLINTIDFTHQSTSAIKYDVDKLTWVNHEWLKEYPLQKLSERGLPFLLEVYPQAQRVPSEKLQALLLLIQPELKTLKDIPIMLSWYFQEPTVSKEELLKLAPQETIEKIIQILNRVISSVDQPAELNDALKKDMHKENISPKVFWHTLRLLLTGSPEGIAVNDLLNMMEYTMIKKRIEFARGILK